MEDTHKNRSGGTTATPDSVETHAPVSVRERQAKGIPPIAEALGYIGGAPALAAVAALMITFWSQMGIAGHVGIGVALALAGLLGGFALRRIEGDAAQRLSRFLLFAGVAGVDAAVGFAMHDVLVSYAPGVSPAEASEWGWFAGAAAVALTGGLVWWRERSILQHLEFGVGVAAGVASELGPDAAKARRWLGAIQAAGLARRQNGNLELTEAGAFWLHLAQNHFALSYVNTLWAAARRTPWPHSVSI